MNEAVATRAKAVAAFELGQFGAQRPLRWHSKAPLLMIEMERLLAACLGTLLLLGAPPSAKAAQSGTTSRVQISLAGVWDFQFDPTNVGEQERWFDPGRRFLWRKATVPGSYNEEFALHPLTPTPSDRLRFYQGNAWYQTRFMWSPDPTRDSFLHLSGAVLRQQVWLNGKLVGASNLPFLDVVYDVSRLLHAGKNTLVVKVDNRPLPRGIPDTNWHGWWNDGGLIRTVYLEQVPHNRSESFIDTRMMSSDRWQLGVDTTTHSAPGIPGRTVTYLLRDASGRLIWESTHRLELTTEDSHWTVTAALTGISPWSPERPILYQLVIVTRVPGEPDDVQNVRVGFRQVETRDSAILLNGTPLTIRGVSRHEFLGRSGMSPTPMQNRADIRDIKAMGANFVRLTHYSQSADVYDACDELGLLVWTEIPAWQSSVETLTDPTVWRDDAQPQLRAMVQQHRNHPSVIIYSVANEIPSDEPAGAEFVSRAISYVRSLDPTRLVTFASDRRETDISMSAVDVVAVNEYFGWYYGELDDVGPMLDDMHNKYPHKPILVSEYGSESVAGWDPRTAAPDSDGRIKDYSLAFQVRFLTSHMQQIYAASRRSFVAGGVIWIYNDFPDPHRLGEGHPVAANYRNSKGLVTMDRKHKPAYELVKAVFHRLAREVPGATPVNGATSVGTTMSR